MNPTTIRNDANKIVRVTNISNFDFTAEMGAMFGGVPYFVPSGKSLLMPMPVGKHLAKHLARQIVLKNAPVRDEKEIDGKGSDRKLWDDVSLAALESKIVSEVYEEDIPAHQTEAQVMARKIEELNKVATPEATVPTSGYVDKAEVIAALQKRGIKYDARTSKAALENLLNENPTLS